jgi:glycosyltransferase involved in cell wall biosynthesis
MIFALIETYLPGYKAGGPIRSLSNMVEHLSDRYAFRVFTSDRDLGDAAPFPGVQTGAWQRVGDAEVFYSPRQGMGLRLMRLLRQLRPTVVYANSIFSRVTRHYLALRTLGLVPASAFVIAPRGEISPGALRLKAWKKRPYLAAIRFLPFLRRATWQACADREATEMASVLGDGRDLVIAGNLAGRSINQGLQDRAQKRPGEARFLFFSRISRKKNLVFLLQGLTKIGGRVELTIAGPAEDEAYWQECEAAIARLPPNVSVERLGAIPHTEVARLMSRHSFFVLPTLSENYGHVVQEALASGCPPLISDTTPWRNLQALGIGLDVPLVHERWTAALQACVDMDAAEHSRMAAAATAFVRDDAGQHEAVRQTDAMFVRAIASFRDGLGLVP